jgi:hypothetical protein
MDVAICGPRRGAGQRNGGDASEKYGRFHLCLHSIEDPAEILAAKLGDARTQALNSLQNEKG